MRIFFYLNVCYKKTMNTYVYKDAKDKKIEQLEKDKLTLKKKIEELCVGDNSMYKIQKQNELYKKKLNTILNKDPVTNPGSNKIENLIRENQKLTGLLKLNEDKIVKADTILRK